MSTALQLITGAARLLQVVRKSEALSNDEAQDGLTALNDMLDSWSNWSVGIRQRTWENFNLSPAASYTIGTGQTLNTVVPSLIRAAKINVGGGDHDLEIITDQQYEDIFLKTLSTNIPEVINSDNGYPFATLRMYPQLNAAAVLKLLSEKQGTAIASLTTVLSFQPGWQRAARFNLAIELAAEYGVTIPAQVPVIARIAKSAIELQVAKNRVIKLKERDLSKPNVYSGIA